MASGGQQAMPQEQLPPGGQDVGVNVKRSNAKEDLAFLTSGAKEKLDKTVAGMKGAGHIMTHPGNKQAKEQAVAQTIEEKNKIGSKQANIRDTAHQHTVQDRAVAAGYLVERPGGAAPNPNDGEGTVGANVESPTSSSSDDSSGRARAQIPPDSEEYRSG